jgi:hypothetical protein
MTDYYREGWLAFVNAELPNECPYPCPSRENSEWSRGWVDASCFGLLAATRLINDRHGVFWKEPA